MKIEITFGEKRQKSFEEVYNDYLACWHAQQARKERLATVRRTCLLSGLAMFLMALAAAMFDDSEFATNVLTVPLVLSLIGFFGGFVIWFFVFVKTQMAAAKIDVYERWIERNRGAITDATAGFA